MNNANRNNDHAQGHLFSADRPITTGAEDKLGRRQFAESVASAVRGWRGQDSLVIGMYGPWGCGKSSIKNMVLESLGSEQTPGALVADFNPWQFANREQLTEAFFDQIGIALGKGDVGSKQQRRSLVAQWRRYARYLAGTGELLAALKDGLIWILLVAAFVVAGSVAANLKTLGVIVSLALIVLIAVLKWFSRIAKVVGEILAVDVEHGRRSVEEVKTDLRNSLTQLKVPLLAVLDDVDRLTPMEMQELFQLIKVNADFPNVVYLLLCERGTVERNIEQVLEVSGREYLGKIVQVGFDVPVAKRARINNVLFEGLNQLLEDEKVSAHFEKVRWGNMFLGGLQPYFKTLRQVNRYLSTLSFHVSLFRGDGVFEVNPIDLIALEVLRVFEPGVYRAVASSKELLTRGPSLGSSSRKEEDRRAIEAVVENATESHKEHVKEIVKQLFPPAEWALGGSHYGADFEAGWFRELRVCSEDLFDRYFSFAIPEGDISQSTLDRLLSVAGDREQLRTELRALSAQNLLGVTLDRLEAYKQEIPLEHATAFVTAVFDISEDVPPERGGMFDISPAMHAIRIVYWYLKQEEDIKRRQAILREAIRETEGVSLPVQFVALEDQASQQQDSTRDRTVSDESLPEFRQLCVDKIEQAASQGTLGESQGLLMILYRWREWAGDGPPREFADRLSQTSVGAVKLVSAFLTRSVSHGIEDYVGHERWYIRLPDVENFISWEELEGRLSAVEVDSLSEEDRRAVEAFREAVERRRQGKPDSGGAILHED